MRKYMPYAFAALLAFAAMPVAAADHPGKPGNWQVRIEMEMPGMPVKMPPITQTICLTEEDMKDPQKSVPVDKNSECKVSDYKISGDTISWTVDCPKQQMKGKGNITFAGDSAYSGAMTMTVGEQEIKSKYSGKWLGACKK